MLTLGAALLLIPAFCIESHSLALTTLGLSTFGLEYWLDDSLFSMWQRPQKPVHWDKAVFDADLALYASLGIRNITSYGAWIDDYYVKTYGDISFVKYYGKSLRDYRPKK